MDLAYGSAWASTDRSRLARMIVWQESDVSDYRRFPARPVPTRPPVFRFRRSAAADRVPVATVPVRKGGRLVERDLERFLRSTGTTASLAIKGDTLVSEVYFNDPNAPKANSIVPSVTAIVPNDRGELLLVHKTDNDLWALPGGGMDVGESMAETVVREVKEETGIDVEVTGVVGIYTDPNHVMAYDDGEVRQQCSICFTTRMLGGQLATSSETSEVEWVAPTGWTVSISIPRCGCESTTSWSGAARPISAEQPTVSRAPGPIDRRLEQRPGPNIARCTGS